MIRLLERLLSIDWSTPLTNTGGGPMLDRELEARIRADERQHVIRQTNTARGRPPRCVPGRARR